MTLNESVLRSIRAIRVLCVRYAKKSKIKYRTSSIKNQKNNVNTSKKVEILYLKKYRPVVQRGGVVGLHNLQINAIPV
jgi:hypothetical protein